MFLVLSICASSLLFVIFKLFEKHNINTLQAIVINYFAACLFGLYNYNAPIVVKDVINSNWFIGAIVLGFLFISIFNVMALTAQRNGISVASVSSKMSVIIPIIFGLYAYNESLGIQKLLGIIVALVAVYLASVKSKSEILNIKSLWLPTLLFFGSGIIDTSIKYIETTYLPENGIPIFSASIFFIAGLIGVSILIIKGPKKYFNFNFKTILGGIVLGIANYYSIYTLLKALNAEHFESSTIFTVNNVAIVMLSTLIGLLFFKEKLLVKNWIGIALAIIAIVLVTLS